MDFEKLGYEDLLNRLSSYNENTDKDILDRFNFWIDEHYKILVCGRGNTGQLVAEYIKKRDKSVEFVDSDFFIDKSWREDRGYDTGVFLAVSSQYKDECLARFRDNKVEVYYDAELLYALFRRRFEEQHYTVIKGKVKNIVWRNVLEGGEALYIVFPASIGNTLYACMFIGAYKSYGLTGDRKVVAVAKKNQAKLVESFPSIDCVIVSKFLVEELTRFSMYTQIWHTPGYLHAYFKVDPLKSSSGGGMLYRPY